MSSLVYLHFLFFKSVPNVVFFKSGMWSDGAAVSCFSKGNFNILEISRISYVLKQGWAFARRRAVLFGEQSYRFPRAKLSFPPRKALLFKTPEK